MGHKNEPMDAATIADGKFPCTHFAKLTDNKGPIPKVGNQQGKKPKIKPSEI